MSTALPRVSPSPTGPADGGGRRLLAPPDPPTAVRLLAMDTRRAGLAALVVPPAVVLVGALMVVLSARLHGQYQRVAVTVVESLLPLAAGIMVGGVLAAERSMELQLTLPARLASTVLRRVGIVMAWTAVLAAAGAAGLHAAGWWRADAHNDMLTMQLAWIAPTMALCGIGFLTAAWSGSGAVSGSVVSGIWLVEQTAQDWFAVHAWAQRVYLFPFSRGAVPDAALTSNRITLLTIGVVGIALGWMTFAGGDRLLGGSARSMAKSFRTMAWAPRLTRRPARKSTSGTVPAQTMPAGITVPKRSTPLVTSAPASRTVLLAALRYELRMQLTKRSVWVAAALLGLLFAQQILARPTVGPPGSIAAQIGGLAFALNLYAPVIFGCLLADRLIRDRRLGVVELLDATPSTIGARLTGKYFGTVLGCLIPLGLIWLGCLGWKLAENPDPAVLGYGLAAFCVLQVPAMLFVGAFALGCPTVLGTPLFRVLFVGYWFWGNAVPSAVMPTLSGTWLAPVGSVARLGLFGNGGGFVSVNRHSATVGDAVGSIGLLLLIALAVVAATVLRERRIRAA